MDEQRLRAVLTELAEQPAPPSSADPERLFRTGRRSRTTSMVTVSVIIVVLLGGIVAAVRYVLPVITPTSVVTGPPTASLLPYVVRVPPVTAPSSPAFVGPYCRWSTSLPGTIEQLLPHVGTWGTAQQVSGICGHDVGTLLPVVAGGRTGTVQVVVSSDAGTLSPQQNACLNMPHCEQLSNGYLGWQDAHPMLIAPNHPSPSILISTARLVTTSNTLIDIMAMNEMLNASGDPQAPPAHPAMSAPPYTGQQLAQLASGLSIGDWLSGH